MIGVPDARRPPVLRRHVLPATSRATDCRHSAQVLEGVERAWREQRDERRGGGRPAGRRAWSTQGRLDAGDGRSASARRSSTAATARDRARPSTRPTAAGAARPKFPQPMTIEFLLRRAAATGDAAALAVARRDARRDGRRRHARPARRRLPPLRDRRGLARAALRADALRQRPARPGLPARVGS